MIPVAPPIPFHTQHGRRRQGVSSHAIGFAAGRRGVRGRSGLEEARRDPVPARGADADPQGVQVRQRQRQAAAAPAAAAERAPGGRARRRAPLRRGRQDAVHERSVPHGQHRAARQDRQRVRRARLQAAQARRDPVQRHPERATAPRSQGRPAGQDAGARRAWAVSR
ncbi:conserved hypothetical protein [Ricinus communis]|uniref:Uncharacterized protein n=1 Tax=Ricinus communis TaxID=3988 RepID=B9TKF3_RICCO|nr:conserved hypothetical protein [Ricinus communis]